MCSCPQGFTPQPLRVLTTQRNNSSRIGSTLFTCAPQIDPIPICSGVSADPTGQNAADPALQACIDAQPLGTALELPLGNFRISSQVRAHCARARITLVRLVVTDCGAWVRLSSRAASRFEPKALGKLVDVATAVSNAHVFWRRQTFSLPMACCWCATPPTPASST
jgi:hypothetical protein